MLATLIVASPAFAGAWGVGSFANDDALDWVLELEQATASNFLIDTLRAIDANSKYVEAPECTNGLAAAEVVAAALGRPSKALPKEVAAWLKRIRPTISPDLVKHAKGAVTFCRDSPKSELRQLWEESKEFQAWLADTANLLSRLK
jgi:hypothetical protein